jgi:hypothetical protein
VLRDRVQPVFDAVGQRTMWLGPAGRWSRLKLATNRWVLTVTEGCAAAIAFTGAWGWRWLTEHTQPGSPDSEQGQVLDDADVFIGVSSAVLLGEHDVAQMAAGAIVFAWATGRSSSTAVPSSTIIPDCLSNSVICCSLSH